MTTAFGSNRQFARLTAALALFSLGCISGESTHNPGGTGGTGGSSTSGTGGGGGGGGSGGGGAGGVAITGSGGQGAGTGSGGAGSGGVGGTGQTPLPLPVVVTTVFNNQGWFGDAAVTAYFATGSTIIRQANSTTGPCAARAAGARGSCLQVVYTPPPALAQADGGAGSYVGVFMLTTLMMAHPELTPPAFIGDANWGAEPGRLIAPGATRISFSAASATDGVTVAFRAGTATDPFTLPEQNQTLTTSWTSYQLSLAGITYSTPILGGFAWVLHDTSKPATFYIDGIVWE